MENNTGSSTESSASEAPAEGAAQPQGTEQQQQATQVKPKQKFKYKADGAEIEEELDDTEIGNRLSLAKAAQKRMQEASMTKKQVESFMKALQTDPMSVLSNPKIMGQEKFQEIAEAFLAKKLQDQMLTPEERERIAKDEKLSKYEKAEKEREEQLEKAKATQLEAKYAQQFEQTIMTALQSSNLPKNPFTVKRMAELMQKNLQHGLDLEADQLAQLVREDYQTELKGLISNSDAEQMLAIFGEEVANKIRKHDLSKFQMKNPEPKVSSQPTQKSEEKMSPREYTEYLKAKFQNK